MPNRNVEGNYRYKYQGQEVDPETGKEAFELRLWDARIGRWLTTDPYNEFHSPYLGMGNNPVILTDPDGGKTNDEYLENSDGTWKKISDLGGSETDFYHYTLGKNAGKTAISDGFNVNWMSSSRFVLGYTQRNNSTGWNTISDEFFKGVGPENSIMYGLDQEMNAELNMSYVAFRAREKFLQSGGGKVSGSASFGLAGILRSNVGMTEQMVGSAAFSVYPLGDDKVMMAIFDSKSKYSLYYHLPWIENRARNTLLIERGQQGSNNWVYDNRETTTKQTFIWIESVENLQRNHYLYDSRYDSDW